MQVEILSNYLLVRALQAKAVRRLLSDQNGELDEKALLIALFVIVCITGLTALGTAVAGRFTNLAGRI